MDQRTRMAPDSLPGHAEKRAGSQKASTKDGTSGVCKLRAASAFRDASCGANFSHGVMANTLTDKARVRG